MDWKGTARIHCSNCGDLLSSVPVEPVESGSVIQCAKCAKIDQLIEDLIRQQRRKGATA